MQTFKANVDGFHDVADQIIHDFRRRAESCFRKQEAAKAALTSIPAFEAHRARVRANFMDAIGGLPKPRAPLKARVTGCAAQEKFVVEKLIYESLPNFPVTAACYVPKGLKGRNPAVVFVCGHWDAGKQQATYQSVCTDLANNGFVVLAIDPLGQGERSQYFERGKRVVGPAVYEHIHAGFQFFLQGANVSRHFIWDIRRGFDYLETRRDVDPSRIGITGNSGGGTQTCLMLMSEPRLAAAVPCTFVMSLESYLKTGQAQDSEQIVRNCMVEGPDHDDFITMIAPRPLLVGAAAYDFFPIEGTLESVRRAKRIYSLYGKPGNVDVHVDNITHCYSAGLRQACVNWFKKHFLGEKPDFKTGQPGLIPESDLRATKSGQVSLDFPKAKTIFDFNREHLSRLRPSTRHPSPITLAHALGLSQAGDRSAAIYPRVISDSDVNGYRVEKVFFYSATDILVTALVVHPWDAKPTKALPATMLLLENGTDDAVRERSRIESWLRKGHRVFVFDVRGVGGVKTRSTSGIDDASTPMVGTEYKLACDATMLGLSTLGMRVFDVLRGFDYLRTRQDVGAIHIAGIRSGAIYAYFAAAIENGFKSVIAENMLVSYRHLCETRYYSPYAHGWNIGAWGILRHFDLPDLLACLRGRSVTFINPRSAAGETITKREFEEWFLRPARQSGALRGGWQPSLQTAG